jgi:hypothetical protein
MELIIAGVGVVDLLGNFARVYTSLLNADLRSSGDRFDVLRVQILTQRSRLQAVGRVLTPPYRHVILGVEAIIKQTLGALQVEFDTLQSFEKKVASLEIAPRSPSTSRRTYTQKLRLELVELDRLKDSLTNIASLVDSLEFLTPQVVSRPSAAKGFEGTTEEQQIPTAGFSLGHDSEEGKEIKPTEANQLFRNLVSACEEVMRLTSSSSYAFKEVFLSYRLWTYTLETENIFSLFRDTPANTVEQWGSDILKLQYQTLAHLTWTLCMYIQLERLTI